MSRHDFTIRIPLEHMPDDGKVHYIAPCPPDHRSSFTGSGMPFANPKQAFQGSPNMGTVDVPDEETPVITLSLAYPNAFYVGLGTVYVPPTVYLRYAYNGQMVEEAVQVSKGVPFRMLTYPGHGTRSRKDAMFYDVPNLPVRSQESILRASAYPDKNEMPENFWGTKPPV